jgi:hypothetical protein
MIEHKLKRCEPDDPRRCQAVFAGGQCPYVSEEGIDRCKMHAGGPTLNKQERENIRNYRIAQWQARVEDFATNPQVKSLREEIGILRLTLESVVIKCATPADLIMYASKISDLVMKIEKLVSTCHRLESSLGVMIDKMAAMQLANEMVAIIGDYVKDPTVVSKIADEIGLRIEATGRKLEVADARPA